MKSNHSIFVRIGLITGVFLIFIFLKYIFDASRPMQSDVRGRPVLNVCSESVHGKFNQNGERDNLFQVSQQCSNDIRPVFSNYVSIKNNIYWVSKINYEHSPCITGTGDTSGLIYNITSWGCLTAKPMQVNKIEKRDLYLVAKYSSTFRPVNYVKTTRPYWQSEQLASYAKDESSVYFRSEKIKEVNPEDFQVIFPFGKDDKWRIYNVFKSNGSTYVGGYNVGDLDLSKFHLLSVVSCPEHGLTRCTGYSNPDTFFRAGNWGRGVIGDIGNDVIFLQPEVISRFSNMASPDMFMFASSERIYLYTHSKFYEVVEGEAGLQKKLVEMDKQYFEQNP
ncbi:DKNYY domain-containing protein [Pantoea agglomerans]|uniref:DKNYY domain-containing protein n=1 Tax=Enterobacter agglomerans TaxID=549 RepID=UPI0004D88184|nr:DKNYY domain-containing protein [Pantoea agglomerans]KEY40626.1 hypothetical protein FB99_40930 [Pantoea agglomerans]QAV47258.1 hypothetical protein D1629_21930 [Pantoea agglomerans]QAV51614.1 hypothetical protein D1628_20225 [Pantoea agglomerans]